MTPDVYHGRGPARSFRAPSGGLAPPVLDAAPVDNPLPIERAEVIVERLERARAAAGGGLVAFDADGTLWGGDVGVDCFEALLAERAVRPAALEALRDEARAFGVATDTDPNALASRLYEAYRVGSYPEDRACALMAWAYAGFRDQEARLFAARVVAARGLGGRFQHELDPIIAWAATAPDVRCFIVSASPDFVVEVAAAGRAGGAHVLAAAPERDKAGVIGPALASPLPYAEHKLSALNDAAPIAPLLGAFGDNHFDAALLARAVVPVAVRPKDALIACASRVPGLVTLAPVV